MEYYGYEIHTTGGELYHYGVKGMKWKRPPGRSIDPSTFGNRDRTYGLLGGYYEWINKNMNARSEKHNAMKEYKNSGKKSKKSKVHVNATTPNWRNPAARFKTNIHG